MSETKRMPKGAALYVLAVTLLGALAMWATFNGHIDAVMVGLAIFFGILLFIAICIILFLCYEAIRSLIA